MHRMLEVILLMSSLWIIGKAIPENCYEELFSYSGSITSLNYPQPYPSGRSCTWVISTISDHKVQLVFEVLDVESHPWCKYDYVKVFDGDSDQDKVMGKFCGQRVPLPLISTRNVLRMVFVSDARGEGSGFKASYMSAMCGGNFYQSEGGFESPDFPSNYTGYRRCIWTIETAKFSQVSLFFDNLDISESQSCSSEYLEIYSLSTVNDPSSSELSHLSPSRSLLLTRVCGTSATMQISNGIRSTSNQMYVLFVSEGAVQGIRFQASYKSVTCGDHYEKDEGTFVSANYPVNYLNNLDCVWTITVSEGYHVALAFPTFQVSYTPDCTEDYIEIGAGLNNSSPLLLDPLCGTSVPHLILSPSNVMWIRFKSDSEANDVGFLASYRAVSCGGTYEEDEGTFLSVNYPGNYPNNMDCVWTITVSAGYQVVLQFNDFQVSNSPNCSGDYMEIRDGLNSSSLLLLDPLCGTAVPHLILSPSNKMWIRFKSDSEENSVGFFANFTAVSCGGHYEKDEGSFASVNYPFNYPNNMDCSWTITVSEGYRVALQFNAFEVPYTPNCTGDYVDIRDGSHNNSSPLLLDPLCGNSIPHLILSPSNKMWLRFKSDSGENGIGFLANFTAVSCGGHYENNGDIFVSVNYPGNYPNNMDCIWTIAVSEGYKVALQFNDFQVSFTPNCTGDYMEIRDGLNASSPLLLDPFCGISAPRIILSPSNEMWIRFKSDSEENNIGFFANFTAVPCGGHYEKNEGTFASVNYPLHYLDNMDCVWTITVSEGYQVVLQFTSFQVTHTPNCSGDYIEIRDVLNDSSALLVDPLCGNSVPHLIISSSNEMWVRFKTDSEENDAGFFANFTTDIDECVTNNGGCQHVCENTIGSYICSCHSGSILQENLHDCNKVCGGDFEADEGELTIHINRSMPSQNIMCIWTITVPEGYQVALEFMSIKMPDNSRCREEYTEIRNGLNDSNPIIYPICHELTRSRFSTSNTVQIIHTIDTRYDHDELYAKFTKDIDECATNNGGCEGSCENSIGSYTCSCPKGKSLTKDKHKCMDDCYYRITNISRHQQFTSPNYPNNYQNDIICTWILETALGKVIQLGFYDIDTERSSDFISIFDGNSENSFVIFSGGMKPAEPIYSSNNSLKIVFQSDENITAKGFRAYFNSVSCGGHYEKDAGTFASANYPLNYPDNMDCTWTIVVSEGYQVALQFTTFQVSYTPNCAGDYMEIRDGVNGSSPLLLGPLCGTPVPQLIRSSSNEMWIRFKSDSEGNDAGYFAYFRSDIDECATNNGGCQHVCQNTIGSYVCSCHKGSVLQENFHGCHKVCGGNFEADEGELTIQVNSIKPGENIDCIWTITVARGYQVDLQFMDIQVPQSIHCRPDYVELRNGLNDSNSIIYPMCHESSRHHRSTSNIVQIAYTINASYNHNRLFAKFAKDIDECAANNGGCQHVCKNTVGSYICSCHDGSILQENLHSCYKVCGGDFEASKGNLAIHLDSTKSRQTYKCNWTITVPTGYKVALELTPTTLEYYGRCEGEYAYVEIRNGQYDSNPMIHQNCLELTYFSTSNTVQILHTINSQYDRSRLFGKFVKDIDECARNNGGCEGTCENTIGSYTCSCPKGKSLTEDKHKCKDDCFYHITGIMRYKEFTSPNYPNGYPNDIICTWILETSPGRIVELGFTKVNTEREADYISVFDGNSGKSLGEFSGDMKPSGPIYSSHNSLKVVLKSDDSFTRQGFKAYYSSVCGERLTALPTKQFLYSHTTYGSFLYPNDEYCDWIIEGQDQRPVTLHFISFYLEGCFWKDNDYVIISQYNGSLADAYRWGKYCDMTLYGRTFSNWTGFRVQFRTDGNEVHSGFKAEYYTI